MEKDRNSKDIGYPAQFGIFIGLVGAGMIIGTLLSIIAWLIMTGRPVFSIQTDMQDPKYYSAVMTMQVVSTLFTFFLPVIFFAMICYRKPARFIGFNTNINFRQVLLVLGILFLTYPLSGALAEINKIFPIPHAWAVKFKNMEETRSVEEAALISINTFPRYILSLIVIGLLPGLFEEMAFRSGMQQIFCRWFKSPLIAIVVTSIIFSAVHFSYYGFLVRMVLGIILGYIFLFSGNIWLSVLFHFLYNGLQVTALYFYTMSGSKNQKDIEENFPLWTGLVALLLIIYFFDQFRKISRVQKQKIPIDDFPDDDFLNWVSTK
jgi:CAAX protease family protein